MTTINDDDGEFAVRKSYISSALAALLLAGLAGCKDDNQASAGPSASAAPSPSAPASSAPVPTPSKTASSAPAPPADKLFPLAIARRGGFAGVDDRATIAADGSAVVTRQGRAPVRTSVPAGTMAELRRLLKSPELTGRTTPDATTVCNDGYEYEFASPSSTTTVLECDDTHGAALDRMLAVAAELFNN